jgi:hypothetical protein
MITRAAFSEGKFSINSDPHRTSLFNIFASIKKVEKLSVVLKGLFHLG